MKKAAALMLLALIAGAASASTDVVRLAPGEVPVHVIAQGKVRTPADRATLTIPVSATGQTSVAARAATRASAARVEAALKLAGVAAASISSGTPTSLMGFIGNEEEGGASAAALAQAAGGTASQRATILVQVSLNDVGLLPRIEQALDAIDQPMAGGPQMTLANPGPARRTATAAALADARRQAEAYAAALGMRVARVLAVSDSVPSPTDAISGWTIYSAAMGVGTIGKEVETTARVEVDYALTPH